MSPTVNSRQVGVMSLSTSNRQMSVAPLAGVEQQGRGSLGGGGFALGLQNTLSCTSQAVRGTHPLPVLQSLFHQGQGLGVESALSCQEGSCRPCSSSFARALQPVFVVMKASGSWRPVIDLPLLNLKVIKTSFKNPVSSSVSSPRRLDGVSSVEGCLLADSCSSGQPQVSQIRGFWPGVPIQGSELWSLHGSSGFYQGHGFGLCFPSSYWYQHLLLPGRLADPSGISFLDHVGLDAILHLCQSLGIIVNWEKSHLVPAQQILYLGILLDSQSFRAWPDQKRVEKLPSIGDKCLSYEEQPASSWLKLLGVL